jgi:hypothetical protein
LLLVSDKASSFTTARSGSCLAVCFPTANTRGCGKTPDIVSLAVHMSTCTTLLNLHNALCLFRYAIMSFAVKGLKNQQFSDGAARLP